MVDIEPLVSSIRFEYRFYKRRAERDQIVAKEVFAGGTTRCKNRLALRRFREATEQSIDLTRPTIDRR